MQFFRRGRCPCVLLGQDELATAVRAYLVARGVGYSGPTTIRFETPDENSTEAVMVVDPSGRLIDDEGAKV